MQRRPNGCCANTGSTMRSSARQLFERLSRQGRLTPELAEIRRATRNRRQFDQALASNPAAVQFAVEAEAWLSHFEAAAPGARRSGHRLSGPSRVHGEGSLRFTVRSRRIIRRDTEIAVTLGGTRTSAPTRATEHSLAKMGDIFADRELFRARRHVLGAHARRPSPASRRPIWTPPPSTGTTTATTMRCAGSPRRATDSRIPRSTPTRPARSTRADAIPPAPCASMSRARSPAKRRGQPAAPIARTVRPTRDLVDRGTRPLSAATTPRRRR